MYGIHDLVYRGDTVCGGGGHHVDYEKDAAEDDHLQEGADYG